MLADHGVKHAVEHGVNHAVNHVGKHAVKLLQDKLYTFHSVTNLIFTMHICLNMDNFDH